MNQRVDGILNHGTMNVAGSAVGSNARVTAGRQPVASSEDKTPECRAEVGVITILPVETQAVRRALDLRSERIGGITYSKGDVDGVSVAAVMAWGPGQRSAMAAYNNLVTAFNPRIVVLVGIAGGFRDSVEICDVVVSTHVLYYDLRKITSERTERRGEPLTAPAAVGHAVNAFFADHYPHRFSLPGPDGEVNSVVAHSGPIGSGEAVIAHDKAGELAYLDMYNNKVLAVEMEAGGLGQACHERSAGSGEQHRWLVIRGISDRADLNKNDDFQPLAAWNAAQILRRFLPYLKNSE